MADQIDARVGDIVAARNGTYDNAEAKINQLKEFLEENNKHLTREQWQRLAHGAASPTEYGHQWDGGRPQTALQQLYEYSATGQSNPADFLGELATVAVRLLTVRSENTECSGRMSRWLKDLGVDPTIHVPPVLCRLTGGVLPA